MLIYFRQNQEAIEGYGISFGSIVASVVLAVLHCLLELVQLYFESKACKERLGKYYVVCLHGKFAWVPFIDNLEDLY